MKTTCSLLLTLFIQVCFSQINYEIPTDNQMPKQLESLRKIILVNNFPKNVDAIKIKDLYYWKHNTSILCKESDITIIEYGAYLFYNNQWNLRKSYNLKELDKNFNTKKQHLNHGQPYTWENNWRVSPKLFGGYAMWYFIGKTPSGETVCGFQKINTTNITLN